MKKSLVLLITLCSGFVHAQDIKVHFGLLDHTSGAAQLIEAESINRNNGSPLCWFITNAQPYTELDITEQFTSPPNAQFVRTNAILSINPEASEHKLTFKLNTDAKGELLQCWQFNQDDPIGLYTETLTINNKEYGKYTFQITK